MRIQALRQKDLIVVTPDPSNKQLQPASIDLTLSNEVIRFYNKGIIDVQEGTKNYRMEEEDFIVIQPGEFLLGSTIENIKLPDNIVGRIEGRSSLGRLGLMVHSTAGFIDPGFEGNITLEMYNLNCSPIRLSPKMRICQIAFEILSGFAERPYGHKELTSKYQGQTKVTPSKIQRDFKKVNAVEVAENEEIPIMRY